MYAFDLFFSPASFLFRPPIFSSHKHHHFTPPLPTPYPTSSHPRLSILPLLKFLLPLLLPLPLHLPDLLRRRILDEIRAIRQAAPLGQAIGDIHDALAVKHVAAGLEEGLVFVGFEVHERGEEEDHVAAFVHDYCFVCVSLGLFAQEEGEVIMMEVWGRRTGTVTIRAPHLTRQLVLDALIRRIIPLQIMMPVREIDICFVEDGSPLERRGVLRLARRAVAELGVEGFAARQLVRDFAAVAVGLVLDVEVFLLLVHAVGRALLPLGDARGFGAAGLVFVHFGDVEASWGRELGGEEAETRERSRNSGGWESGQW